MRFLGDCWLDIGMIGYQFGLVRHGALLKGLDGGTVSRGVECFFFVDHGRCDGDGVGIWRNGICFLEWYLL